MDPFETFETFLGWLVLCILVAVFAHNRGKSGGFYFLISIILSPLVGFLIALVEVSSSKKKCFNCGQMIDISAKVCPFCNINMNSPKIIKVNDSISQLILDKEFMSYTIKDLRKIAIDSYDEKYRAEISVDTDSIFSMKGRAEEYGLNYLQIESKENKFIIESCNISIPSEFEIIANESSNSNNDNIDKLIELGKLYKEGLLTREDFKEQKNI